MTATIVCPLSATEMERLERWKAAYTIGYRWFDFRENQALCNRLAFARWRLLRLYRGGLRERGEWGR